MNAIDTDVTYLSFYDDVCNTRKKTQEKIRNDGQINRNWS